MEVRMCTAVKSCREGTHWWQDHASQRVCLVGSASEASVARLVAVVVSRGKQGGTMGTPVQGLGSLTTWEQHCLQGGWLAFISVIWYLQLESMYVYSEASSTDVSVKRIVAVILASQIIARFLWKVNLLLSLLPYMTIQGFGFFKISLAPLSGQRLKSSTMFCPSLVNRTWRETR